MLKKKIVMFVISLIVVNFIFINESCAMEVAITIDDIPGNGTVPSNTTHLKIEEQVLGALEKHHIKGVYAMMNGKGIEEDKNGWRILQNWVNRGQLLGNHTYSHADFAKISAYNYIVDIQQNELYLLKLMANKDFKYFRYPFLAEGNTQEKRDEVRKFLFDNQYQLAHVTVDFFEYEWNDPYVRCLNMHDKKSLKWIKRNYIQQSLNALTIAHSLSMMLFNRDIKNILIIHINAFSATMLDELLTEYEKHNVKFITLPDALSDEVYKIDSNIVRDRAYTFLNQIRLSRGLKNPVDVEQLYKTLPEDKLEKLCR